MKKSTLLGLVVSLNSLTVSAEELNINGTVDIDTIDEIEEVEWLDTSYFKEETGDPDIIQMPWFSKDHSKSHSRDYSRSF